MNGYSEEILLDEKYYDELILAINAAKHTITLEVYTFADDAIGERITNTLCDAAKRGVNVRVLVDGFGTHDWGKRLTHKMHESHVKTRIYHPLPWLVSDWHLSSYSRSSFLNKLSYFITHINSRNHRKICIIDERIVFIGSANIAICRVKNMQEQLKWRDTSIKISGADILQLTYAFEKVWREKRFRLLHKRLPMKQNTDSIFRLNDTFRKRYLYYRLLVKHLKKCQQHIWITNAYFVPDQKILKLLVSASKRGIDVKIILPAYSDVLASSLLAKTFYSILIESNVHIYEYLPRVLHAKTLIIDDTYYVGSSNINYRSIKHDLEVDVKIQTERAKSALKQAFLTDIEHACLITRKDVKRQSFLERLLGWILLFLKHWF